MGSWRIWETLCIGRKFGISLHMLTKKAEKGPKSFVDLAEKINRQIRESAKWLLTAKGKIYEER